ncbi:death domain-containing protein CRADD-like [Haliotis rubra]|uniref:death domain-containing protein CRADD-like n=1 Tax=Haliotis rubra TaxID=36100 RepID=UPI001EE5A047|nr:death domain-containing protein CRADD-like [Haliotis rubra]
MDEAEKRVLGQYRHRLANEIVVTESFLCAFCESNVLDKEMSAVIQNELSYVSKAHRLLELLPKRGYKAFTALLEILSITNPWLAEKMKTSYIEEKNREAKLKIASSITASEPITGCTEPPVGNSQMMTSRGM